MTPAPQYYLITKDELTEVFSFVQHAPEFTQGIEGDVLDRPASTISAEQVLDAKRLFLGKVAARTRHEFTQDDDDEYYLCAEDFENVLDELTQELMDEIEELHAQRGREP